ncbi:MAG TPA: DUF11 domain-containing protein [Candidatus Saccharibacteria bacterium]|nr:DUF11 domain-containing protein [Candidatus Saccharibacteria bacterium]
MFRKLVSNLPFSPSLIHQLSYYTKRLKKEQVTRKIGLVFTALTIIVQSLTVFVPAKPTLAASNNDIIYGGGNLQATKDTYVKGCDSKGRCDIKQIFHAYGIDGWGLASAKVETIYSSAANNYWSIGRAPRGYGGEVARQISGGPTVYSRTLHGWSANRNWNAIRVETGQGTRWILTECGNIVTKESQPVTPVKPPDMKMEKTVSKSQVKKGEKFFFTLKATNVGGSTAKSVLLYDNSVAHLELQPDGLGSDPLKHVMRWETSKRFDIGPGQSYTYKIYAIARKSGVTLKNTACADFFDVNVYNNCATATVTVIESCPLPGKENLPINDPACKSNPSISVNKTSDKKELKLGETFVYTLSVTNKGDVDLTETAFIDTAPAELEFIEVKEPGTTTFRAATDKRKYTSKVFSLGKGKTVTAQVKAKVIKTTTSQIKNTVCVIATNPPNTTTGACADTNITTKITSVEMCTIPGKTHLPKNDPGCRTDVEMCPIPGKTHLTKNDPNCKIEPNEKCPIPGKTHLDLDDPNCKEDVEMCTIPGKTHLPKNDPGCKEDLCPYNPSLAKNDPKCQPCPIEGKTNLWINDPACKPCDETKITDDKKDISCLELHKSARNITQNITNANGTRANTGDTIEYTLSVRNFSKETRKGFVIEENMEDVLEYADIIDASGATFTTNPVKLLSWKPVDIRPGETIKRTVLIKVKSTLPLTPASSSDPLSNDMKMVNVYGDMVQIKLPDHPIKTIEQTVKFLPKTGLGANVIVSTVLIMTATYFYYRSRLMVRELGLVRQQFNYGAGV